ncbi:type II secretion system protein GspK [Thermomonas sp. HDW16]|uniref:general secretion pathway protein GspK n=1 Tax=Thermomonas sp. HDW16 TaxID=2714945 RepID=UPI00140A4899|nr:type II secretion system protein GspK [Thermomonas sp. HDW16]QIL21475.1 general secretion pathway protein GspK [Thermomonas sp. HDW16]
MNRRERGAALLLVMWLILLLSGLVAGYAAASRIESLQGNGLARGAEAREAARAGVEYAAARLLDADPAQRWASDGRNYRFAFDGAQVEVSVRDEAGKIDLNAASHDLLLGFFVALGEKRDVANRLAGAIMDWRDPDSLTQPAGGAEDMDYGAAGLAWGAKDAPFETVAELEQVMGMRPSLFASAAPYLTVFTGAAVPDTRSADGMVLQAMGVDRPPSADPDAVPPTGSGTYSIDSRARLADGRRAHVSVILRLGGNGLPGSAYTPLRWQDGAAP